MRICMRRAGLVALVGLWLLTGCLGTSSGFTDDFSDPASGWGAASHETYVRGYQQGQYLIQIDVPSWFVWTTAGRTYRDVAVEVVTRSEESTDNNYGVLCRYQDEDNFYYFAISADGYYAIFRRVEGEELTPLTGQAMLRAPSIHTDGTENRVLAVGEEEQLTMYVNGEQVAQVQDDALDRGDVGMAAGTLAEGSTIVWFDNLDVRKP